MGSGVAAQGVQVLIATDFDGTLCPIADSPEQVRVAPEMIAALRRLVQSPRICLVVITGRSLADVSSRLPVDAVFAGNHGLEIRIDGKDFQHRVARRLRPDLAVVCKFLREVIQPWQGCWLEDKDLTATVHYRNVESSERAGLVQAVTKTVEPLRSQFILRRAKKALELCPKVSWNKGDALKYIRRKLGPFNACFCLGDDDSDEAMFKANRTQWNIKVGYGPSSAQFYLPDSSAVTTFLASFTAGNILNRYERDLQYP
jgi:trehalose 6-phosphate phosphatase